jgi:hypothetical protein
LNCVSYSCARNIGHFRACNKIREPLLACPTVLHFYEFRTAGQASSGTQFDTSPQHGTDP